MTTAIEVLRDGVIGDPAAYRSIAGPVASLDETLSSIQFGGEHRLQAHMTLLMPLWDRHSIDLLVVVRTDRPCASESRRVDPLGGRLE